MARLALEADGLVVVGTATDGASAVAEVLRLEPDIVLLDVGLPDMTGSRSPRASARPRRLLRSCSRRVARSPTSGPRRRLGARGLIEKSLLSGEAVRTLVTASEPRDILARP